MAARSSTTGASLTSPAPVVAKTPVPMTVAEYRALVAAPARKRTTRKALPRDGAVTVCTTCGQTFTTDAGETRHVDNVHAARFQWLP